MQIQGSFSLGEISELLYARVDYDGYYKAAKRLRNVLVLPQGSVVRRFGTRFIGEIADITSHDECAFTILQYYDEDIYLVIFKPLVIDIYYNDAKVSSIASPYTASEIKSLYFTQDSNNLWITHQDHRPAKLQRVSSHSSWVLNPQYFKNPPAYDFTRNYDTITFTPSAKSGNITLTSSANIFSATYVGGLFFGNSGTLRITGFTSATQITGYTVTEFADTNGILGANCFLGEPAFSDTRGWPKTATFYQDRLVFGGTKSLPEGIFMSATGEFDDFDVGEGQDSDGIGIFIRSDKANIVKHILHTNNLIVFTSSGEWSSPPFTDKPATPKDFYFVQQARNGVTAANPVVIDDQVIFVDKGGKIVRSLVYSVERGAYVGTNISITAPHLIRNPISACTFENPAVYDGSYMLLVNEDGTLAIYQSMLAQNVSAWSLSETDGKFRDVTSSDSNVYFIVERTIQDKPRFFIEKLDFSAYTDNTFQFTYESPTSTITGLGDLEGKAVFVTADGYIAGKHTVKDGMVTLDSPASSVSVGIAYTPEIVPLPINIQTQVGNNLYKNKSVKNVYIDYVNSRGIYVNDFKIPMDELDGFNAPPTPKTGVYIYSPMQGWEPFEELIITQKEPLPMTIRAIGREVQ